MNQFDEKKSRADVRPSKGEAACKKLQIAPLECLLPPFNLNGRDGHFRSKDTVCHVDVNADLEAIQWWIEQTSKTEATARSRRSAMEKLLNWALFEREKAVSSLDIYDFAAFHRFLADPHPADRWIYPGNATRGSIQWRPFRKALGENARRATMAQVSSLTKWMMQQRYADLNCAFGTRVTDGGFALCACAEGAYRRTDPEPVLTVEEWTQIRHTLDDVYPCEDVTSHRLIVELLYYADYRVNDIAELHQRNVEPPNRVFPCWSVYGPARPGPDKQLLCAPPPLSDTLRRWRAAHNPQRAGYIQVLHNPPAVLLLNMDAARMRTQANQVLRHAARLALEQGRVALGLRLRNRSLTAFRRAFDFHQRSNGDDPAAYQLTGALEFRPDIKLWAHGRQRKERPPWDWSHAAHLWTDSDAGARHAGA